MGWIGNLVTTGDSVFYMVNEYQQHLFTHFDFTAKDLHSNRKGQMTKHQQQQLEAEAQAFWRQAGLIILVVLIGTVFGGIGITVGGNPVTDNTIWVLVFAAILIATLAFLIWFYKHKQLARIEAQTTTVKAVSGELKILEADGETIGRFTVNDQIFGQLSQEQFKIMCQISKQLKPTTITVYCSPLRHKLLTIDISSTVDNS